MLPIAYSDMLVSSRSFYLGLRIAKIGGFTILSLSLLKMFFSLFLHFHSFFPVSSVNSSATLANLGINQ